MDIILYRKDLNDFAQKISAKDIRLQHVKPDFLSSFVKSDNATFMENYEVVVLKKDGVTSI